MHLLLSFLFFFIANNFEREGGGGLNFLENYPKFLLFPPRNDFTRSLTDILRSKSCGEKYKFSPEADRGKNVHLYADR